MVVIMTNYYYDDHNDKYDDNYDDAIKCRSDNDNENNYKDDDK